MDLIMDKINKIFKLKWASSPRYTNHLDPKMLLYQVRNTHGFNEHWSEVQDTKFLMQDKALDLFLRIYHLLPEDLFRRILFEKVQNLSLLKINLNP